MAAGRATCQPCRRIIKAEAEKARKAPIETRCIACGETFTYVRKARPREYCDPCIRARRLSQFRDSWYRRNAIMRDGEMVTMADLVADWGASCYLCEGSIDLDLAWPDGMAFSFDHVVPLARGGEHSRANLRPAHLVCNIKKGAKMLQGMQT